MPITTTGTEVPPPIPEWVYWDEEHTREQLDEAPACDCCGERRIVRWTVQPTFIFPVGVAEPHEPMEDFQWVRITGVRNSRNAYRDGDILLRREWLYDDNFCSNGSFNVAFNNIDESYDYMCEGCYEDRSEADHESESVDEDNESSEYVHSYSYRPRTMFFDMSASNGVERSYSLNTVDGDKGKRSPASQYGNSPIQKPFCGFELEMSNEGSSLGYGAAAQYLAERTNSYAYMKEDGSVSNGFELVTHPHTLDAYQNRLDMWSALDYLRGHRWRSWSSSSSCGLHVHINNSSFVDVGHAMRFLKFIYSNKSPLVAFAGRDSSYSRFNFDEFVTRQIHAGWNEDGSMKFETQNLSHVVKKSQVNQGRYLAVNAINEHTYELRFFRGSMRPTTVLACLEFTFALHEYTQTLTSHDCVAKRALTWRAFLAFVRNRSGKQEDFPYRNLLTRLKMANRNPETGFLGLSDES